MKREAKSAFVGVKVSPTQHRLIIQKCQKSGISVSEYMRVCAMQGNVYIYDGLPELILEVRKIGVNVNQIARQSNTYHIPPTAQELGQVVENLQKIYTKLDQIREKVVV